MTSSKGGAKIANSILLEEKAILPSPAKPKLRRRDVSICRRIPIPRLFHQIPERRAIRNDQMRRWVPAAVFVLGAETQRCLQEMVFNANRQWRGKRHATNPIKNSWIRRSAASASAGGGYWAVCKWRVVRRNTRFDDQTSFRWLSINDSINTVCRILV